jgi:hypothetical protein
MTLYITGAVLVFGYSLQAFLRDTSTPKTDRLSWLVLIVASVLWPIALPSIVRKKLKKPVPVVLKTQLS